MDPLVGLVGTIVILSWALSLVRTAGGVLLDTVPDPELARRIRARIETGGDRVTDLHLWQLGPGHAAVMASVVSDAPQAPSVYKQRLARFDRPVARDDRGQRVPALRRACCSSPRFPPRSALHALGARAAGRISSMPPTLVPGLIVEMRYAGSHNFVGRPIDGYEAPRCLLTQAAAAALAEVARDLAPRGLTLKVFDCYRPVRAVANFVRWARDLDDVAGKREFYPDVDKSTLFRDGYIASHSGHSRGSTVDLDAGTRRSANSTWARRSTSSASAHGLAALT